MQISEDFTFKSRVIGLWAVIHLTLVLIYRGDHNKTESVCKHFKEALCGWLVIVAADLFVHSVRAPRDLIPLAFIS